MPAGSVSWRRAWTECVEPVVACAPQASLGQQMARAHRALGARKLCWRSLGFAKCASKSHSRAPNATLPRKKRNGSWQISVWRKSYGGSALGSCVALAARNAWQRRQEEPQRPASARSVASGNAALTSLPSWRQLMKASADNATCKLPSCRSRRKRRSAHSAPKLCTSWPRLAPGVTAALSPRAKPGAAIHGLAKVHTMLRTDPAGCAASAPESAAHVETTCPRMPGVTLGATAAPSRRARADVDKPAHERASSTPEATPTGRATHVPRTSVSSVAKTCPRRLTLTLGAAAVPSRHARAGVDSPARRQSLKTTPKECPAGHAKDAQRSKGRHGSASAASAAARRSKLILRDATSRASLSRPALHERDSARGPAAHCES